MLSGSLEAARGPGQRNGLSLELLSHPTVTINRLG